MMSPTVLLNRLIALFPDFAAIWNDAGNLFREDDGSFTVCGAFAEFGNYFRDHYESFRPESLNALSELLSECMADEDSQLGEAAATCFLENISGERFSPDFTKYLKSEPLKWWLNWGV